MSMTVSGATGDCGQTETASETLLGEPERREALVALVRRSGELGFAEVARASDVALAGTGRDGKALEVVNALTAARPATTEETPVGLPHVAAAVTER
jgi:hypothetical protein